MSWFLLVEDMEGKTERMQLADGVTTIGRYGAMQFGVGSGVPPALECIGLGGPGVSRRHAQITIADGRCHIEDLNSVGGLYVGGHRVQAPEKRQLQHNAVICIGRFRLIVQAEPVVADEA